MKRRKRDEKAATSKVVVLNWPRIVIREGKGRDAEDEGREDRK